MKTEFFTEQKEQSQIKTEIVTKYFYAWSRVILSNSRVTRIGYIDLFSGPGRYEKNGSPSTPLLVLEKAISDERLGDSLVTIFNDKDTDTALKLKAEINSLENIDELRHKPVVMNKEVGDDIAELFEERSMIPSFAFIDPFGYKGLSSRLLNALLKDWGTDCVFFFNYNRINMGVGNDIVKTHMDALFGEDETEKIRELLEDKTPEERELIILEKLSEGLSRNREYFVLPFRFCKDNGRTSHYLIFVTKHFRGYEIMREIMWKASSEFDDGQGNFSYIPVNEEEISKESYEQLDLLNDYSLPMDKLGASLLNDFAGKTLTTKKIYEVHSVNKRFISANYKEALRRLESEGKIFVEPPATDRPKRKGQVTFADHVKVSFPRK